jgi:hypothetical protein
MFAKVYLFADCTMNFGFGFVFLQIAISASNTGGAWDNAKKYIEVKQQALLYLKIVSLVANLFSLHQLLVIII